MVVLEFVKEYWFLITAFLGAYGILLKLYLKLTWKVDTINKDRVMCETRCSAKVNELQTEYNDDLKEIRSDLKETVKLSQNMNLQLVSLTSFLQGKGVTPPL